MTQHANTDLPFPTVPITSIDLLRFQGLVGQPGRVFGDVILASCCTAYGMSTMSTAERRSFKALVQYGLRIRTISKKGCKHQPLSLHWNGPHATAAQVKPYGSCGGRDQFTVMRVPLQPHGCGIQQTSDSTRGSSHLDVVPMVMRLGRPS